MRRIASVFRKSSARSEKSEATNTNATDDTATYGSAYATSLTAQTTTPSRKRSTTSRFFSSSRTNILTEPPVPPLVHSNQASSSASSYEDSLRTPDDDGLHSRLPSPTPNLAKKAWMSSWLGSKKPHPPQSASQTDVRQVFPSGTLRPQRVPSDWSPQQPPTLRGPPPPRFTGKTSREDDSNEDSDSESEDDDYDQDEATPKRPAIAPRETSSYNGSTAARNLRTFTASTMTPPIHPPPLLHLPGMPLFPRSVNASLSTTRPDSLESRMHKTRIVNRLDQRDLSSAEERSIAPFASKHGTRKHPSFHLDEASFSATKRIRSYSQGLQRWADRPCFEDRLMLWSESIEGDLAPQRVTGQAGFAVAALEFSAGLEALAGLTGDFIPEYEPASSASSSSSQLPGEFDLG